jgi:2-hydroxylaminobenzoate mutase
MLPTGKHKSETLTLAYRILKDIGDRPFDAELEFRLNRYFGPCSGTYEALARLLKLGTEEGWVAYAPVEGAGYHRGRIAEPASETAGMSIESALLCNVKGQYHCHTRGEIDMIIPIDSSAQFCGHGAGWMVYPLLSEHYPTVTGGKALFMFFLPNGEIEYKAPASF